ELDEPVQRIAEDQPDHDHHRRDQPVRRRALPETAPPPRPKGSLDGGNHARACLLHAYDWFSTEAMLSLADCAACFTVSLPVRICASMLRRMLPFSTSTQCLAVGTNQLRAAARSMMLFPSRFVAFGMLPFPWRVFSELVDV